MCHCGSRRQDLQRLPPRVFGRERKEFKFPELRKEFQQRVREDGQLSEGSIALLRDRKFTNLDQYINPLEPGTIRSLRAIDSDLLFQARRSKKGASKAIFRINRIVKNMFLTSAILEASCPEKFSIFSEPVARYLGLGRQVSAEEDYLGLIDGVGRVASHWEKEGVLESAHSADADKILYALSSAYKNRNRLAKALSEHLKSHLRSVAGFLDSAESGRSVVEVRPISRRSALPPSKFATQNGQKRGEGNTGKTSVRLVVQRDGRQVIVIPEKQLSKMVEELVFINDPKGNDLAKVVGELRKGIDNAFEKGKTSGRKLKDKGLIRFHYEKNRRAEARQPGAVKCLFVTKLGVTEDEEGR